MVFSFPIYTQKQTSWGYSLAAEEQISPFLPAAAAGRSQFVGLHHNLSYLLVPVTSAHYWVLLLFGFFWILGMFLVKGLWFAGCSCPPRPSLSQVSLRPDPAATLRQGALNLEDNRCTRIRSVCIKCVRNLLPQVGKWKMNQKATSAVRCLPHHSQMWAKHQTRHS